MKKRVNLRKQTQNQISQLLSQLEHLDPSSSEYREIMYNVNTLYSKLNEYEKIRADRANANKASAATIVSTLIKSGIDIGINVMDWQLRDKWMKKGFEFETTGVFGSETFSPFMKSLFRPK